MSRLFGFLLGVCVTLAGIYWFLRTDEVPASSAAALRPIEASVRPIPGPGGTERSDAGLPGDDQSDPAPVTAGLAEAAVLAETLPQAQPVSWARPKQGFGGDRGGEPSAMQETADVTDAEPTAGASRPATETSAPQLPGQAPPLAPAGLATPDLQVSAQPPVEDRAPEDSVRYVFWSPFRSERAARGFADRLSLATAVQVDVVRLEPGRYRVAFDYRDESERRALLERIEQITGLDLSGDDSR